MGGWSTANAKPELRLLLACARLRLAEEDGPAIRKILSEGIDWTAFARAAIGHGLMGLAGHTLAQVAADMVPNDVLNALPMTREQMRRQNNILFLELANVLGALEKGGISAIPFQGPFLGFRVYGDMGFRTFGHLRLLIRDPDIASATATLCGLGYERRKYLTAAQLDLMRRLQGHETLFKKPQEFGVDLHTRMTPMNAAVDIDYAGLWSRAQRTKMNGRIMLTLSPEDQLLILTLHDSWTIGWACDTAAFINSHSNLDWITILEHARAQGFLGVTLLATALARIYFNASVPHSVVISEARYPAIESITRRIAAYWLADKPFIPASSDRISTDWLRLYGSTTRRVRYMVRSLFLPGPQHVARIPLPTRLTCLFSYVVLKIAQNLMMLPLVRVYSRLGMQTERLAYTLASYRFALAVMPISADVRRNLKQHQVAREEAKRALVIDPNNLGAWRDLGDALFGLRRYKQAIACYDKVLASAPDSVVLWEKRGRAILADDRAASIDSEEYQIPDPQDADAWARRAGFLYATQRPAEAAAASDRALAINPGQLVAMRIGIRSRIACCDWRQRRDDERRVAESLREGHLLATPFNHRAISESEADNFLAAQIWAKGIARPSKPLWNDAKYHHDRIRLAYVCAEFHDHPTARHIVGVLEHHDNIRFEITAISLGPRSPGELRKRIEAACDYFIDAQKMSDIGVATIMHDKEIDIAIDLNGHAGSPRPGILAQRPAAIQVNYLGNAGTTGAPFMDYIIADRTIIPSIDARYFTEKIIYLPDSYQCNDSQRCRLQTVPLRIDLGLPETAFVYCCFNSCYKISPAIFDVWMRILNACPQSVLWLLSEDPGPIRNLRREAAARGIVPERLVFGLSMPIEDHLARHCLADLFLDTLPMNAHATASDSLWAGLPVLTCVGNTFGGRVGASLLQAIGMPELVTHSLTEYEELAVALARDSERLAAIRRKLMRNRDTEPLFNTAAVTRDLESAYTAIWRRQRAGLAPANIVVRATDAAVSGR